MPILVPAVAGAGGTGAFLTGTTAAVTTGTTISSGTLLAGAAVVGTGLLLTGDTPVNSTAAVGTALTPDQLSDRLKKAKDLANSLAKTAAASCATGNCCQRTVVISRSASPQSAQHIEEAQAMGFPSTLTLDRAGTAGRRAASLRGIPTIPGFDRDEYPPATFMENGGIASVRHIPSWDNQSAGSQLRWQMNRPTMATEGCRITILTGP